MGDRIKVVIIIYFVAFFTLAVFACASSSGIMESRLFDFIPGPTLLYPVTNGIVLDGKDFLEFKWIIRDFIETDYFDFRLYRGYNTTAANLIFKERFPLRQYPIKIPANLFEANQVYTWVLVQVFIGGRKSDRSTSSFKIIKK
jgi:hypothetical protein